MNRIFLALVSYIYTLFVFSQDRPYMKINMGGASVCFYTDRVDSITFSTIGIPSLSPSSYTMESKVIDGIGDSMTRGAGGNGVSYLNVLNRLLGEDWTVNNYGIGGESAATIFGRINSTPFLVDVDSCFLCVLDTLNIDLTNVYGHVVAPLKQSNSFAKANIGGVGGTLYINKNTPKPSNYFFVKERPLYVTPNMPIEITQDSIMHNSCHKKIIWVGQNGGYGNGKLSGSARSAADVSRLISMIMTYLIYEKPSDYLVLSPPCNTSDLLESMFESAFGDRFLNVRSEMINNGITRAIELKLIENATNEDLECVNDYRIPKSFVSSGVHFNETGYTLLAYFVYDKIKSVWKP